MYNYNIKTLTIHVKKKDSNHNNQAIKREKNKNRQNLITMNHILAKNNEIYNFS